MDGNDSQTLVLLNAAGGVTLISEGSPLTRLNYFDGKFLRAEDLQAEQTYLRRLVQMSNKAHGAGLVHGLELRQASGDRLRLSPGLAIDNEGRVLFLGETAEVSLATLLSQANQTAVQGGDATFGACAPLSAEPGTAPIAEAGIYVLGVVQAEALCGYEDVYGQACQQACVTESARPYRVEGVALQARPLVLSSPLPTSTAVLLDTIHLRSRVASAYFADERAQPASLISQAGLASSVWCAGAQASAGGFVPLGVVARSGQTVRFLDLWTARRERGETHPVRYWRNRLAMRPLDVFLAQVLQFQCQLRDSWNEVGDAPNPCADEHALIAEASDLMGELETYYKASSEKLVGKAMGEEFTQFPGGGASRISALLSKLRKAKESFTLTPTSRVLITKGIVELPSGGYLPVTPASNLTVNEQIRRLMGEGVDLRFCVVRPDYVAHALESVQQMDRISLLKGLDDPSAKEEVDILVPDGQIGSDAKGASIAWEGGVWREPVRGAIAETEDLQVVAGQPQTLKLKGANNARGKLDGNYERGVLGGAARSEVKPDGEVSFFFAGLSEVSGRSAAAERLSEWARKNKEKAEAAVWQSFHDVAASPPQPQAASPEGEAMEIGAGYARLKERALHYRADLAARRIKKKTSGGQRQFGGLVEEAIDHQALWVGVSLNSDPFAAPDQARISGSLDITFVEPRDGDAMMFDLALTGDLIVQRSQVTGSRQVVRATLDGGAVMRTAAPGASETQRIVDINLPVILTRRIGSQGVQVAVRVDLGGAAAEGQTVLDLVDLKGEITVAPDGQMVDMSLLVTGQGKEGHEEDPVLLMAGLKRNNAAILPGSAPRAASETAIQVLGAREGGASFVADAEDDLFGRTPAKDDPLVIRATRDWVMFHRRRDKQCRQDALPVETGVRRYQLYHLLAKSSAQARVAATAVVSADAQAIIRAGFRPVAAVEFAIGRSSLVTPAADLLTDWQAANPGNNLVFGAIGAQGPAQAEGETLARARLANLEVTVNHDSQPSTSDNLVLPLMPDLGLSGLDGAVFLVTQAQKRMCHTVYLTENDAFPGLAAESGLAVEIEREGMEPSVEVVFENDATLTKESLKALQDFWNANNNFAPPFACAYAEGANDTEVKKLVQGQAAAIIQSLNGDPLGATAFASPDVGKLTKCKAITVMYGHAPRAKEAKIAFLRVDAAGGQVILQSEFKYDGEAFTDEGGLISALKDQAKQSDKALPFGPSMERMGAATTLALLIDERFQNLTGGARKLEPIDVIHTDLREMLQEGGLQPDEYDLLIQFR